MIINGYRLGDTHLYWGCGDSWVGVGGFFRADLSGTAWNFGSLAGISSTRLVSIDGFGCPRRSDPPSSSQSDPEPSEYSSPSQLSSTSHTKWKKEKSVKKK